MSKTIIKIDLVDKEFYLSDVYPTFNYYYRSFSSPVNLLKTQLQDVEFGTLEKNQFALSGNQYFFNSPETNGSNYFDGLHSYGSSNDYLWNNYQMTLTLNEKYKSKGIQLRFSKYDYCNKVNAKFYLDDTLLKDITVDSDYYDYFVGDDVEIEFNKVVVTFIKCNNKKRTLKLYHIGMGETLIFKDNQIISANVLEQCDPLCNELPINQAEFELYDKNDAFNILNPKDIYSKLKARLPIDIYHEELGDEHYMGKFYLDTWESDSEDSGKFTAVNLIGLLDTINTTEEYITWEKQLDNTYTYKDLEYIINVLFSDCDLSNYYIYNNNEYKLNTIISKDTGRNLLQKLCFTGGLTVSDARDTKLTLQPRTTEITSHITLDRIWQDTMKITKENYINKFEIYGYNYTKSEVDKSVTEIAKYTLLGDGKTYTYTFDKAHWYANIHVRNGKAYIISENSVDIEVSVLYYDAFTIKVQLPEFSDNTDVTFKIMGNTYDDNKELYTLTNTLDTNEELKAITVDVDMISIQTTDTKVINNVDVAKRLQNYYSELYDLEFECQLEDEKVGDYVKVDCQYNQTFIGYITSLDIDLSAGYTAKVKMIGGLYNES